MYRRIFIILILSVTIILFAFIYHKSNKQDTQDSNKSIQMGIDYFNNNVLSNTKEFNNYFNDRYVNINYEGLSVGKSKNELDNGYYDIDIKVKKTYIDIYVNKLFKELDKDIICDELYVNELIEYITKIFNLKIDKKQLSQLIINNYEIIRDIDRNNVDNVDKTIEIDNINITITMWQNMLVLKMGDK